MKSLLLACSSVFLALPAVGADLIIPYDQNLTIVGGGSGGDWAGVYAGIFGGYTGGTFEYNGTAGPGFPYIGDAAGGAVGFQLGADYQVNDFVIGGVADIAWAKLGATATGGGIAIDAQLQYIATIRGRAGVANDVLLGYVHGGVAFGSTTASASYVVGGGALPEFHGGGRIGYTLGAGVEAKMTDKISVFGEYAFTDLGSGVVFSNPPGPLAFDLMESLRFHTVKVGVNYRF